MFTKSLCCLAVCGAIIGLGVAEISPTESTQGATALFANVLWETFGDKAATTEPAVFDNSRADCPGQLECPITGELVCEDRCPLTANSEAASTEPAVFDDSRADCPGQVECPITGALVCEDRCPLTANSEAATTKETPSCCAGKSDSR